MKIVNRYASAINASTLKSDPRTTFADVDVIGAYGIAGKYEPLGAALTRMLTGGGVGGAVEALTNSVFIYSQRVKGARLSRVQARDLATAVLSWYRHGTCQPCGGTGYKRIQDTPVNGDECDHCAGTGKLPFDRQFSDALLPLARWLSGEIERSQSAAGTAAMRAIAPMLDL